MFTGIVEEVGKVLAIGNGKLKIKCRLVLKDVNIGDSIAVNGICLTVTHHTANDFTADVMPETIRRTSLAELKAGSSVNLERALTLASRLGGHIVSGHIDGTGKIAGLKDEKNALLLTVSADKNLLRYIVEKGSIALDGISLTVASVTNSDFTVSLIPHTREITNLAGKKIGSPINIETDIIGKYVEKMLQADKNMEKSTISHEFLLANGF